MLKNIYLMSYYTYKQIIKLFIFIYKKMFCLWYYMFYRYRINKRMNKNISKLEFKFRDL